MPSDAEWAIAATIAVVLVSVIVVLAVMLTAKSNDPTPTPVVSATMRVTSAYKRPRAEPRAETDDLPLDVYYIDDTGYGALPDPTQYELIAAEDMPPLDELDNELARQHNRTLPSRPSHYDPILPHTSPRGPRVNTQAPMRRNHPHREVDPVQVASDVSVTTRRNHPHRDVGRVPMDADAPLPNREDDGGRRRGGRRGGVILGAEEAEAIAASEGIADVSEPVPTSVPSSSMSSRQATLRRRTSMVFKRRDHSMWGSTPFAFRMAFHSMCVRERSSRATSIVYGDPGLPLVGDEPGYLYDSMEPDLIMPRVTTENKCMHGEMDISCTARYLEFEFGIYTVTHTLRVNVSEVGVELGDVRMLNKESGEFEWFNESTGTFDLERPDHTRTIAPLARYKRLREMARTYAVAIPVAVLNGITWDSVASSSSISIELVPDMSVQFDEVPPDDYDAAWVMRHVCLSKLPSAVAAIIDVV